MRERRAKAFQRLPFDEVTGLLHETECYLFFSEAAEGQYCASSEPAKAFPGPNSAGWNHIGLVHRECRQVTWISSFHMRNFALSMLAAPSLPTRLPISSPWSQNQLMLQSQQPQATMPKTLFVEIILRPLPQLIEPFQLDLL